MDITIIILDIIENSIEANAKNIFVSFEVDKQVFNLLIEDDGKGMGIKTLQMAGSPGYSTKNNNRGMGLFQFRQFLKSHNGLIKINSQPQKTTLSAKWEDEFNDDLKKGLAETVMVLAQNFNKINFEFKFKINNNQFIFTSKDVLQELNSESYLECQTLLSIKDMIYKNINSMEGIV